MEERGTKAIIQQPLLNPTLGSGARSVWCMPRIDQTVQCSCNAALLTANTCSKIAHSTVPSGEKHGQGTVLMRDKVCANSGFVEESCVQSSKGYSHATFKKGEVWCLILTEDVDGGHKTGVPDVCVTVVFG